MALGPALLFYTVYVYPSLCYATSYSRIWYNGVSKRKRVSSGSLCSPYMAGSIQVLYYACLYGSIWYYSIMASLLVAKSSGYMGHLAANRD